MTDELATRANTLPAGMEDFISTERPEGADSGVLGNEGIGREDIVIPRLGLAQLMSPQLIQGKDQFIEGLKFGELFHSLSKKIYGKGPLHFVILRRYDPRFIEFFPIDQGGGIKDMNVPAGDPRTQFTTDGQGRRVKPVATMFYDFMILLLNELDMTSPMENVIALSLKSSGIKAAKHLNFLVQQRGQKLICKGVYSVETGTEIDKKSQGTYAIYKIKNAGWLKPDSPVEKLAIEMYESWKDRVAKIDVDDNPLDEVIDDSMAANPESPASQM